MLRRAFTFLALAGLAACTVPEPYATARAPAIPNLPGAGPASTMPVPPGRRIAALLPLTGPNAEVGQALQRAAQLSLDVPGAPPLDVRDTAGTPDGALRAAQDALAAGAGLIIGPLTAQETDAVAPLAQNAGVPVLAFTSDPTKARPGVWVLGITPEQQVRRLVQAVQTEGKSRLAGVVPEGAFGNALAEGLNSGAAESALPPPTVRRYAGGFRNLDAALKDISDYAHRRGALDPSQRAGRARLDTMEVSPQPDIPPPPFDALLLGAVGEQLGQAVPLLSGYDIGPAQVRIMGPALWARDTARLKAVPGAWYAAPDPALRRPFEQRYAAKFGGAPRDLASLAYDAAGIARAAATPGGFDGGALLRPEGFGGADGLLALQPDGRVRRGLAIFETDQGGSHIVQPAPSSLAAPGV